MADETEVEAGLRALGVVKAAIAVLADEGKTRMASELAEAIGQLEATMAGLRFGGGEVRIEDPLRDKLREVKGSTNAWPEFDGWVAGNDFNGVSHV